MPKAKDVKRKGDVLIIDDKRVARAFQKDTSALLQQIRKQTGVKISPSDVVVEKSGVVKINSALFAKRAEDALHGDVNVLCDLIDDLKDISVDVFCG